jgi:hypothetical protein
VVHKAEDDRHSRQMYVVELVAAWLFSRVTNCKYNLVVGGQAVLYFSRVKITSAS